MWSRIGYQAYLRANRVLNFRPTHELFGRVFAFDTDRSVAVVHGQPPFARWSMALAGHIDFPVKGPALLGHNEAMRL